MLFARLLRSAGRTWRCSVELDDLGWSVCEEADDRVLIRAHYHDWHRVERTMALFDLKAVALERQGWTEGRV